MLRIFILAIFILTSVSATAKEEQLVLQPELSKFQGRLTFQYFLDIVKRSHPKIIQAQLDKRRAEAQRIEAQGAFDPSISSGNFFNRFNSSSAVGDVQNAFTTDTSIDWLSGYGAKFSAGGKLASGDIKTPISPTGDAGEYYLRAQVPLLRNAIYNEKNVKEQQAKLKENIADFKLYQKKLEVIKEAIFNYWKWISDHEILRAQEGLLEINRNQVEQAQEQVKFGGLANIEAVELQREVQKRLGAVAKQLMSYNTAAIKLTNDLWQENGQPFAILVTENVPELRLDIDTSSIPSTFDAKLNALENRPEFKSIQKFKEIAVFNRKFAKNQMLPALDLYGYQGVEFGGDSIGPTTQAGVELLLPLRNRRASGKLKQAKIDLEKLNVQERQLAQQVFLEIENAAQLLENNLKAFNAARDELEFAQQLADGEKSKFDLGASTIFLVIRRQRSLIDAKINMIKSFAQFKIAAAEFVLAQGMIEL